MIQVLWLLATVAATRPYSKTCPKIACGAKLPAGTCLANDEQNGEVLVAPCQGWETCPVPNGLENLTTLTCYDSRMNKYATGAQTYEEYLEAKVRWMQFNTNEAVDFQLRQENESCYDRWDRCNPEKGLVCHCEGFCRCVPGAGEGEVCSSREASVAPMCTHGFGCHKGRCRKWFDLPEGEIVSDAWLCRSMAVDPSTHACLAADYHTTTQLETPCGSDEDCRGVHGLSGSCECGVSGLAYCQLLSDDEVYRSYQDSIVSLDVPQMTYWAFVIDFWVHLQRHLGNEGDYTYLNPLPCIGDIWPETTSYYDQVQTDLNQLVPDSASALLVAGLLFTLN